MLSIPNFCIASTLATVGPVAALEGAVVCHDALKHAQDAFNHGLWRFDGSVSDVRQGEEKGTE
jgi:hypothetical protein